MNTLENWLERNGNPHHETRFQGKPFECVSVCCAGLSSEARAELWHLSDYFVASCVSGQFVELQRKNGHS